MCAVVGIPGGKLDFEFSEAEGLEDGFSEVDAGDYFIFNLAGCAEDVRVVLSEAADAQKAVHGSGALVTIDVAELGETDGKIAIAARRIFVDENVAGAVHRFEAILGVVELHGRVHVAGVKALVAADLPELAAHDVGSEDERVTAAEAFVAHPVFHDLADDAALGMPEDESGAGELLNAEEVELFAEDAMVAACGFFKAREVCVHFFLARRRRCRRCAGVAGFSRRRASKRRRAREL